MHSRVRRHLGAALAVLALIAVIGGFSAPKASANSADTEQASKCAETPKAGSDQPLVAVLGASFTAGVGPDSASLNWAIRLAELLGWRARTLGDPGVGYANPGEDRLGPLSRLVSSLDLSSLHPNIVIIQAGHNDWREPANKEKVRVESLVRQIEHAAPDAHLVFLTGFSTLRSRRLDSRVGLTNNWIVKAISSVDKKAIVIDPLSWKFDRSSDGLHPTSIGDLEIAHRVASVLVADHLATAHRGPVASQVTCELLGNPHSPTDHHTHIGWQSSRPSPARKGAPPFSATT